MFRRINQNELKAELSNRVLKRSKLRNHYVRVIFFRIYYYFFTSSFCCHEPGPDFAIVSRETLLYNTRAGLLSSVGVASGVVIHVGYCLLGIGLLISQSIMLFNFIKYVGAAYLIYLGIKSLLTKEEPIQAMTENRTKAHSRRFYKSFSVGFVTNLLNPKATLFFLAIFTTTISVETPIAVQVFYGGWLALVTFIWFAFVALFLSHSAVKCWFVSCGRYINKVIGTVLIGLGIKITVFNT